MKINISGSFLLLSSFLFVAAWAPVLAEAQDVAPQLVYTDWLDAAEKGDAEKAYMVGIGYYYAWYGASKDYVKARQWLIKAAEGGHAYAPVKLGEIYRYGRGVPADPVEALKWYRKSAEKGNAEAMEEVGAFFYHGSGVRKDYALAAAWYRKAADAGWETSASKLGRMYMQGEGVKVDYGAALKLLSSTGDPKDCVFIALIYRHGGDGVKADPAKEIEYLLRGANAGDAGAMQDLGDAYAEGRGLGRDYVEAYKWLSVVSSQLDMPSVREDLSRLSGLMSASELSAAKKKAAEAIEKYK